MTGARDFVSIENGIQFKIPKSRNGINFVKITLNSMDTYNIEFGKIVNYTYKEVSYVGNVFFDKLQEVFTENTGLYTKL
jgi:hypothetical protein